MVRELSPEKRERFLNAALQLFAAQGVQNTSTAEIAKLAGTAAGTLFIYFPTKQQLINELAIKLAKEQSRYIHSLLDPSMNARDTFYKVWNGSIHWLLEHMEAFGYIQQVRDASMIPPEIIAETGKSFDYYYLAIQKGLQENAIKPYRIDLIGGFLYQDIIAVMNILKLEVDPSRQQEAIDNGFEIFWNGIKES